MAQKEAIFYGMHAGDTRCKRLTEVIAAIAGIIVDYNYLL